MSIDGPLGNVCIGQDATVRQALETIDRGASAIALVTDESGKLQGVLTDGDIRRGLLKGADSTDSSTSTPTGHRTSSGPMPRAPPCWT